MNFSKSQDAFRRTGLLILGWRIARIRTRLDKCQACTPQSRDLMLKLIRLVQQRNNLHTPADVARIEKERGLA